MEFLLDIAGFLSKTLIIVIAIIAVILTVFAARRDRGGRSDGQLNVSSLNDFYDDLQEEMQAEILDKAQYKAERKALEQQRKHESESDSPRQRVFVLDFDGDMQASEVSTLRQEISAVLSMARPEDEVVIRLESPGGVVHGYGLAASQLARIRDANIPLTICIDKVAASGGYLMACIGNKIISAPFAVLGSIGVVAQVPNIHRLLKKHDVDVEMLTAGEYKRSLTLMGENTEKGREKFQEDLETTHLLFKQFVHHYRPQLDMDRIATGEVWLGTDALKMQLVDELQTSDSYLTQKVRNADVYSVNFSRKKPLTERMGLAAAQGAEHSLMRLWSKLNNQRWL